MYIGAINYGLYYGALRGRGLRVVLRDVELRSYVFVVAGSVLALTVGILANHGWDPLESFRYAFFMVATTISSTGYGTDDYMAYPAPMLAIVVFLMFVGGCAGSTAGGIKVERVVLLAKQSWRQITQFFRPNVVRVVRMGRRVVDDRVLADVSAFFIVYLACMAVCVLAIATFEQSSVPTAFGATLTCLSNMGPAPFYVGADNFASYGGLTKLLCTAAMLLGRLEFFTLLALLIPGFWKS
jgi:trk system potassium uptake protein TrkH